MPSTEIYLAEYVIFCTQDINSKKTWYAQRHHGRRIFGLDLPPNKRPFYDGAVPDLGPFDSEVEARTAIAQLTSPHGQPKLR